MDRERPEDYHAQTDIKREINESDFLKVYLGDSKAYTKVKRQKKYKSKRYIDNVLNVNEIK